MFWDWQPKTKPPKANFIPNNHDYKNCNFDPDAEKIARAGLKYVKANRALKSYEQTGEKVYDHPEEPIVVGHYAVNLAHHTELKKNSDKNLDNFIHQSQHLLETKAGSLPTAQRHQTEDNICKGINSALSYAKKKDNYHRAWSYLNGTNGFSTAKDRENKGRRKRNGWGKL